MIQISARCRLGRDPQPVSTKTGTPMAVGYAACDIPIQQSEDSVTEWLNLVCFGRLADELLRHQKGDLLNIIGTLSVRRWSDRQTGETRQAWGVTVEGLLSARTTRPRGGKPRPEPAPHSQPPEQPSATAAFYDDELPF